jgi:hypothetical protein
MDEHLKKLIRAVFLFKIGQLLLILLASHFFPFNSANYLANFTYPTGAPPDTWTPFKTWDAQHYLFLADHGYAPGQWSNVFYPLFPFLIHIAGFLFFKNGLLAGLFLSLVFTLMAMFLLYRLVKELHGPQTAYDTCLFLLAFPTGFYLGLVYTESLFLALTAGYFYFSIKEKPWAAAFCAFLLPLTRPIGILILPAACWALYSRKGKKDFSWALFLGPAGFLLGFGLYLGLMTWFTNDPWIGFGTQNHFRSHNDLSNLVHPLDWFMRNFIHIHYSLLGVETDPLNRLFFLAFILALVLSFRRSDRSLWIYALVLGLFPAMISDLMSYMRYLLVVFPLFIFLAQKWGHHRNYYLLASLPLQVVFLVLHALNEWVA